MIAWAAPLLQICSQNWWSMFGMRNGHDWTLPQFGIVLLNTIFIYMLAGLVFPDLFGEEAVILKIISTRPVAGFSLGAGTIVISVLRNFVLDSRFPNHHASRCAGIWIAAAKVRCRFFIFCGGRSFRRGHYVNRVG